MNKRSKSRKSFNDYLLLAKKAMIFGCLLRYTVVKARPGSQQPQVGLAWLGFGQGNTTHGRHCHALPVQLASSSSRREPWYGQIIRLIGVQTCHSHLSISILQRRGRVRRKYQDTKTWDRQCQPCRSGTRHVTLVSESGWLPKRRAGLENPPTTLRQVGRALR